MVSIRPAQVCHKDLYMNAQLEVNYWFLRFAVVFIILQSLALSDSWAANNSLPPVSWRYSFALREDQVSEHDKSIQKAAAKNNATVAYKLTEKGGKKGVQVVLDGNNTTVLQLNDIILGANAGIKSVFGQSTRLSIQGYVAKQSPIRMVLTGNITTGYQWKLDVSSLSIVDGNETGTYEQTSPLLGGAGRQTFVLHPLVDGNVAILINYGKHGETTDEEESGTLDIQVNGSLPQTLDLSVSATTPDGAPLIDQESPSPFAQVSGSATPLLGLPTSYDLRTSGGLTGVKNQGQCGSCWAFSTVGVLEGLIKTNTGASIDLSEQFLVSCNRNSWSCDGGWFAHDYHKTTLGSLQSVAGAVLEADMPYSTSNGTCTPVSNHPYTLASWSYVGNGSSVAATDAIKNAIYSYGPVGAAVCVGSAFLSYSGGVFKTNEASTCSSNSVNHAIVLMGWDDSTQTWLLRNSWGTSWGESGYMRIAWGTSNIGFGANYARYANTCTYGISPTSTTGATTGGSGSISVTTQSSCAWTASSNSSWISIVSGSSGSGSGSVGYVVSSNSGSPRTGTITAAGQSFTVTQQGTASCTYTTNPTNITASASGIIGNINVTTQSGCAWNTSNTLGWASIVSGSSGTGNGTVVYSVSPNTGSARTGALIIAGQTVSIAQQAATQCTYSLNSVSNSFNSSGGSGTVSVLTQSGCAWTAASGISWLTIVSGASGTGNGTVSYLASANTSTANRSGSLSIGGQTFTVNQMGGSQGGDAQLSNGVALARQTLTASVSMAAWKYYSFTIPAGTSNLIIDLYGLSGDLDLFGRQGDKPTSSTFACDSYQSASSNEQCVITSPDPGTWWLGVNNYDVGTISYTIRATWGTSDTQLTSGVAASGSVVNSPTTIWKYYYIDVPSGATRLVADLYNLTGDADIYLKYGAKPDISSVDECDSLNIGTTPEQCDIASPSSGRWWLAVINYDSTASYSIKATTIGGSGSNSITGTSGNDTLTNGTGSNTVDGLAGLDTYVSKGAASSYYLDQPSGIWTLTDRYGSDGIDTLRNIERLRFSTGVQAIDVGLGEIGGMAYRIYKAAFNRTPDNGGLKFWMGAMDAGASVTDVAVGFIASPEFIALYGSNSTDGDFITRVYSNVLGREPDTSGYNFWVGVLRGGASRPQVLVGFSESPENIAAVAPSISNGIWMPD